MAYQFRGDFTDCPPWLTTGTAERYMYTLKLMRDLLLEKAYEAVAFRCPGLGDPSQLPYLAHDRGIVQGPAETNATFVLRLQSAIPDWGIAGSARAVLSEVQAYLQNLQPGVSASLPLVTIVGGPWNGYATWHQLYQGDALGALPTLTTVAPSNFNWDGLERPWRAWLVLFMSPVATGQSGTVAQTTVASGVTYFPGIGSNVGGVWMPLLTGTPAGQPWMTLIDLTNMSASCVGQWITISGSLNAGNNGTFQIVQWLSSTSVVIANPAAVAGDAGPLTWSTTAYPYIAPGLAWGAPGTVWGQGEITLPASDTGHLFQGVWQPVTQAVAGIGAVNAWGLSVPPNQIVSIRGIVQQRKSAATYYPNIVVAFDGAAGAAGSAYSPNSTTGAGNPDGTFGDVGKLVAGVWVPTRKITSDRDCYCQGTGRAQACSQENVT